MLHIGEAVGGLKLKANLLRSKDAFPPDASDTEIDDMGVGLKTFPTNRVVPLR